MSKYYCKCCDYNAKVKGNYLKHLKTLKHQRIQEIQSQNEPDNEKSISFLTIQDFE